MQHMGVYFRLQGDATSFKTPNVMTQLVKNMVDWAIFLILVATTNFFSIYFLADENLSLAQREKKSPEIDNQNALLRTVHYIE